MNHQILR